MARAAKNRTKDVESLKHREARRKHIPTTELESLVSDEERAPKVLRYKRNTDLDPQLVWRGKDEQDGEDLTVDAVPIYIQEKIQPEQIISDLKRRSEAIRRERAENEQYAIPDLYSDFNGLGEPGSEFAFYKHDKNWSNRMILGDSLLVMTSLAEKEALKGQVQCIYMDPPYGIAFDSNWQPSTKTRNVKEGQADGLTREPEMIRAFRDTWKDGVHSYLSYLRDRLSVARDLLSDAGSIFVQIGDENVHRVRALMDEIFGEENFIGLIWFRKKTMPLGDKFLERMGDYIAWYGKNRLGLKFHRLFRTINITSDFHWNWRQKNDGYRLKYTKNDLLANPSGDPLRLVSMWPPSFSGKDVYPLLFRGREWTPPPGQCYPSTPEKLQRLAQANRLEIEGSYLRYVMRLSDDSTTKLNLTWSDTIGARDQRYVVETGPTVVERCILMTTDPGDIVLDPTCGSGTTAFVAEERGRRWITIDTSRVALALARQRLMAARYPSYLLQDSPEGARQEGEITGRPPKNGPFG